MIAAKLYRKQACCPACGRVLAWRERRPDDGEHVLRIDTHWQPGGEQAPDGREILIRKDWARVDSGRNPSRWHPIHSLLVGAEVLRCGCGELVELPDVETVQRDPRT